MSRLEYAEEEEWPGQWAMWAANNARSIGSRAGQASLRELEAALLAMPSKRLVANVLAEDGEVCALGALIAVKAPEMLDPHPNDGCGSCSHDRSDHWGVEGECMNVFTGSTQSWDCDCLRFLFDAEGQGDLTVHAASKVGVPHRVAVRVVQLNDNDLDRDTPEERYSHVLQWVQRQLASPQTPAQAAAEFRGMWG